MNVLGQIVLLTLLLGACKPTQENTPSASWTEVEVGDTGFTDDSGTDGDSDTGENVGDSGASTDTADSGVEKEPAGPIVVYAVRHAEKESEGNDPGLTKEGQARAEALVEVMARVPLGAIYATEKARTQETVAPTAEDHGLKVVSDIDPEEDLVKHILADHAAQSVLHAGHSYTLPDFFEAIGAKDADTLSGYGQLWIITVETEGAVSVEMSSFGD